ARDAGQRLADGAFPVLVAAENLDLYFAGATGALLPPQLSPAVPTLRRIDNRGGALNRLGGEATNAKQGKRRRAQANAGPALRAGPRQFLCNDTHTTASNSTSVPIKQNGTTTSGDCVGLQACGEYELPPSPSPIFGSLPTSTLL